MKLAISLILALIAVSPLFAAEERTPCVVLGSPVNIRSGSAANSPVIDSIAEGQMIDMLQLEDTPVTIGNLTDVWAQVRTPGQGRLGYVFAAFLFPLYELTANPWLNMNADGVVLERVSFAQNGTFAWEASPDANGNLKKATGRWQRAGRTITLTFTRIAAGMNINPVHSEASTFTGTNKPAPSSASMQRFRADSKRQPCCTKKPPVKVAVCNQNALLDAEVSFF